MNWLKKLFKKEEESVTVEAEEHKEEEVYVQTKSGKVCEACESEIFGEQKSVTKAGKVYHVKPCWRNLQKMAKKEAFG